MPDTDTQINVEPKDVTNTRTISYITIEVTNVVLFTSATIYVKSYDSSKGFIQLDILNLVGDDYTNWSNNDDYITNYVYTALNLIPLPTVETQPPSEPDQPIVDP